MININKVNLEFNNNNLDLNSVLDNTRKISLTSPWCNTVPVNNPFELSERYQDICEKHYDNNKWILMINPESDSLEQLSNMGKINPAKILKVNANKVNVSLEHIKNTLLKGTCSAMILSGASYNQEELNEIAHCAAMGKTHCILLQPISVGQAQQLH
ncbi:hypothetical protein H4J50_10835 [Colwellia sp. 6M3]|uniref:hypothetical protein n=1 Tax=Colwellia sp. 6M3 TaxID=2759849 RepID=UPI0015F44511|nr:hypothetical protein [Colwellia sp. 6M3]MBA6416510.1 hypothetical protein [Colwellia sp. 6M3]